MLLLYLGFIFVQILIILLAYYLQAGLIGLVHYLINGGNWFSSFKIGFIIVNVMMIVESLFPEISLPLRKGLGFGFGYRLV